MENYKDQVKVIVIDPKTEYENLKHYSEKENLHMLTFGELGQGKKVKIKSTDIHSLDIEKVLNKGNLLITGKAGSGKTLAAKHITAELLKRSNGFA